MRVPWAKIFFGAYLLFLVWADATTWNPADPDLWHRLTLGEALWQTGHFPSGDAFSYLADYQNISDHEWGGALIFYALFKGIGPSAIVGLKLLSLALTLGLLALAGLQTRRPTILLAAFYAVVLLALLPSFQSTVRCMIFTHIFLALWLLWYQMERRGHAVPLYGYIATMVLWANLHGGFAIGLAWLFGIGLVEFSFKGDYRKWFIRFGLCLLSTLINPFGWQLWTATLRALFAQRQGFGEWGPVAWWPEVMSYPGYKLLIVLIVAIFLYRTLSRTWSKVDYSLLVIITAFVCLSITSARHTSILAAVAGALLPALFPPEISFETISRPILRIGYMALTSLLLLIPLYTPLIVLSHADEFQLRYPEISCPVAATAWLKREKLEGKLLVPFNYGSYAMWELRGKMRVSMDGRYDLVYRPETYRRVDDFYLGRGDWRSLLTAPTPDAILVPRIDAIYPKLRGETAWTEAWHDTTDAVFLPRRN